MDAVTQAIASFAARLEYADVPAHAMHGMKVRLVDTIGCALGGLHGEPVAIARKLAGVSNGAARAHVLFTGETTSIEAATFANELMVRYLDFNDTYMAKEGGHPSDTIAGTLAVADALGLSGHDALVCMVAAFETVCSLAEVERLGAHSIDHSLHVAIGTAVGASKAMGLSEAQTAHAVAMATSANVSLKVARDGHLSMWKAGSAANAAKSGVFCAQLAALGMTGPGEAFLAPGGLAGVLGEEPGVPRFDGFHTDRSSIKAFPAQYNAQAAIWAALELREALDGTRPDEMVVSTYGHAVRSCADPSKWDVRDRETADHSLPYLVAAALVDGEVTPSQFTNERIADAAIQSLIRRIKVVEDPAMTAMFPGNQSAHIDATAGGRTYSIHIANSKGHEKNPLSDGDIEAKFRLLARDVIGPDHAAMMMERMWSFDAEPSVTAWVESLAFEVPA